MARSEWFKALLKSRGYSQRRLALKIGLDPAALSRMVAGKHGLDANVAIQMATVLGISIEEFLENFSERGSTLKLGGSKGSQVKGWVDGSLAIHMGSVKGLEAVPAVSGWPMESVGVLRCQTTGSSFDSIDGALIYYPLAQVIDPDALGRLCVVKTESGKWLLRIVRRGYRTATYNLLLFNSQPAENDVKLEVAQPVVWLKM